MNGKPIQQTIVKRSVGGRARTERVWRPRPRPVREAAYRRLAAAILDGKRSSVLAAMFKHVIANNRAGGRPYSNSTGRSTGADGGARRTAR